MRGENTKDASTEHGSLLSTFHIKLVVWDLGDTLITPPSGGQDLRPLEEYPEIRVRSGAVTVLRNLAVQGYKQAVLSNTAVSDSNSARRLLAHLGIENYFDVVVATASELDPAKPGKPDSVVFDRVLKACHANHLEAVMVGNTWDTDILGANRSGMHAVWLQNPDVAVRRDLSSPIITPPCVVRVWDIHNVPDVLAKGMADGR